jgi:hypothetical protein
MNAPEDPKKDQQSAWVKVIVTPNTGANSYNGERGAGWLEVKGYFAVARFQAADAPPGSIDYQLRAVAQNVTIP